MRRVHSTSRYMTSCGAVIAQAHQRWSLLGRLGSVHGLTVLALFLLLLSPSLMAAQELPDALLLSPGLSLLPGGEARVMPGCNPFHLRTRGASLACHDLLLSESNPALLSTDDVPSSPLQPLEEGRRPQ